MQVTRRTIQEKSSTIVWSYILFSSWEWENTLRFDVPTWEYIGCSSVNLDFKRTPVENQLSRDQINLMKIIIIIIIICVSYRTLFLKMIFIHIRENLKHARRTAMAERSSSSSLGEKSRELNPNRIYIWWWWEELFDWILGMGVVILWKKLAPIPGHRYQNLSFWWCKRVCLWSSYRLWVVQ